MMKNLESWESRRFSPCSTSFRSRSKTFSQLKRLVKAAKQMARGSSGMTPEATPKPRPAMMLRLHMPFMDFITHDMYISTKAFSMPSACTVRAFIKESVTICWAFVRFSLSFLGVSQ